MNKKIIILIVLILIFCIGIGVFFIVNNKNATYNDGIRNNLANNQITNKNIAVIYFSATGNTKKIAEYIKDATDGNLIEIEPKEEYTSEDLAYSNDCRANREQQDENARPEIKNYIDVNNYDVIYLGYPIWWGTIPKIILTFLDNYDLSSKTVIPFCTSGGTGISQSEKDIKAYNKNINWLDGKGFYSSSSENEVTSWVSSINF